ncbi:MAG: transposase [Firmicutes bacterium]|nr:transposase [Bacillota bacterium]MCL2256287.1 transposase [Bacillota bacterium]
MRNARQKIEGQYFHVMMQGIGRELVFPDYDCKGFYLSCLRDAREAYPVKILGFCIMSNHAHVLVSVKNVEELSRYFKRVNASYARYYNRVNNRAGYVFRNRFRSDLIVDESHLAHCLAYIHNNPLKAGMVEKAEDYFHSSYSNYLKKTGIVDFEEAAKFYDTSPASIRAIMDTKTELTWVEHCDRIFEKKEAVLAEVLKKNNLSLKDKITHRKLLCDIAREVKLRSNVSMEEIAVMLGVKKSTLYLWLRKEKKQRTMIIP